MIKAFTNPVAPRGADPWITKRDGIYYYCHSLGNGVAVARTASPVEIASAKSVRVYTAEPDSACRAEYWAPELHYLRGEWYIYVAADDGDNYNHRMYVLRGSSQNPLDPFTLAGQITADIDRWAIDGTVMNYRGELYFIWSGWEGVENIAQNLYIAHMKDPTTLDSPRVLISKPELEWELHGKPLINEGPCALIHGETAHIVYSASGSWTDDYCLGLLTLKGGDPLDKNCWVKADMPILSKAERSFGPGHCSFVESEDGAETYVVYHANLEAGTGWGGRSVRIQPIRFDGDTPVIGKPLIKVCESSDK